MRACIVKDVNGDLYLKVQEGAGSAYYCILNNYRMDMREDEKLVAITDEFTVKGDV